MNALAQPLLFSGAELIAGWPFGDLAPASADFIMADPPWRFSLWSSEGEEKSAQAQYATMSLDDIRAMPVHEVAAPDCLLWLWATAPLLPEAIVTLEAWGFRYVTMGAWHKTTRHGKDHFGTGYVLRSACEPFLIGKRGTPPTTRSVRNIVTGPVREHSRKPDAAYRAAEELMPGAARVELFAREARPGWRAWGNETGKFDAPGDSAARSRPPGADRSEHPAASTFNARPDRRPRQGMSGRASTRGKP